MQPARQGSYEPLVGTHASREVERLRAITRLLDSALPIPGTRYRFGLDPLIGLVPGIGDVIGAILSTLIIVQAARLGAPKSTLLRMLGNVGIDTIVGEVPLLGDLFDFAWKSNNMNLSLLEEHLRRPTAAKRASRRVLLLVGVGLLLLFVVAIVLGVAVVNLVLEQLK